MKHDVALVSKAVGGIIAKEAGAVVDTRLRISRSNMDTLSDLNEMSAASGDHPVLLQVVLCVASGDYAA